jgi:hypothetical protein
VLKVSTTVSLLITVVGAAAIGLVPYTHWSYERDRRNLLRAREPFAKLRAGTTQEATFQFTVPADRQWRGLVKRLGRPTFVLIVDAEPGAEHTLFPPATNENLLVKATHNDSPLIITATGRRPLDYPTTRPSAGFKFDAAAGDVVRVSVRGTSAPIPNDAFLMVFPLWNGLELWHWGDSLSMGEGFFMLFMAPLLVLGGASLIFVGGRISKDVAP